MSAPSPPAPALRRSTRNAGKRAPPPATDTPAPVPKKSRTTTAKPKPAAAAAAAEKKTAPEEKKAAEEKKEPVINEGDALPSDLPEISTHSGASTSLAALLEASTNGIVVFAYPKASTPGCTTQACSFRDAFARFQAVGYSVFGLSGDAPAANDKFRTKQSLGDITLLSDPSYALHARLGIRKSTGKGTVRSVVVVRKEGGVVLKKTGASPGASVDIALKAIGEGEGGK